MAYLTFISDDDLKSAVSNVLKIAENALKDADKKFGKNVIDPFSALFEIPGFGLTKDEWIESEKRRQAQKTLQNSLGTFHQQVIGGIENWEDKKVGGIIDLVNTDRKIIAELKNKYNTVTGSNLKNVYDTLDDAISPKLSPYKDYIGYYVEVIPKGAKRYDVEFTPSDNKKGKKKPANAKIRKIDGYTFYALATGIPNALEQLLNVLPEVINDLSKKEKLSADGITFIKAYFDKAYTAVPPKSKKLKAPKSKKTKTVKTSPKKQP